MIISSFYFVGYTGMQIPSGFLVDKFGKKNVLIPGFTLFAIGAFIVTQANTINIIYAGSLLAGVGTGGFYGAAYSLSNQNIPQDRNSTATAVINSGSAIGQGLSVILASFLVLQLGLPWQSIIYLAIILIVSMIISFDAIVRNNKEDKKYTDQMNEYVNEEDVREEKVSFKTLFQSRMLAAYALYFATCYANYMLATWLPNFLATERGFEGAAVGLSSSLVAFSSIPGALIFSRIADKNPNKKVRYIIILTFLAAITLVVTVQATTTTLLLIGLISYGFLGKLAVEPIIISWMGENAPRQGLGTSLGVFNFFGMISSVIAPSLTGYISDVTGTKVGGFYLSVIFLIIGGILFMIFNRNTEKTTFLNNS